VDKWDWCVVLGFVLVILSVTEGLFNRFFLSMGPSYSYLADAAFLVGALFMVYGAATAPFSESPTERISGTASKAGLSEKTKWRVLVILKRIVSGAAKSPFAESPTKCISKIASKAGLSEKTKGRALVILRRAEETGISTGKDPMGLAAAALYVACILEGEDKTQKDLAEAAGVTEVTIRNRFKCLRDAVGI
jgi:hypothetical protein